MSGLEIVVKRLLGPAEAREAYCCMAEAPTPWPEALELCRDWVAQNLHRYVEGYHAQMAGGETIGHLYYALSEHALVPHEVEPGVAVIYCEWTQSHYQRQGVAQRLFDALVADLKGQDCKGILVECRDAEGQAPSQHYLSRGFKVLHASGQRKLLYFPLRQPSASVRSLTPTLVPHRSVPVEILVLSGYWCPVDVSTQILLLDVARELGDRVVVRQECLTPETLRRYGVANGIFINGRQKLVGAASEEAIRQAIAEEM